MVIKKSFNHLRRDLQDVLYKTVFSIDLYLFLKSPSVKAHLISLNLSKIEIFNKFTTCADVPTSPTRRRWLNASSHIDPELMTLNR